MRRGRADNSIARGGMVSLATWLAVLLAGARAAGPCAGDRCPVPNALSEAPPQAVVRIVNVRGTVRCYGSGTVVSTEGLGPAAATPQGAGASGAERPDNVGQVGDLTGWDVVLTCAHLFRQGVGRVTVALADGRQCEAGLLAADPTWDLAALRIAHSGVRPVAIADDHPRPGEPLRSCGYGPDGRYGCNRGRALGYARVDGAEGSETLSLSGAAREGDSGGPVLNEQGELVAVLWGTDGRTVQGTYCGRIRKFLAGVLAARRSERAPPAPPGVIPPDRPNLPPVVAPPVTVKPPSPDPRWDELRRQWEAQTRAINDRLERLDQAVGLIGGLKDRLDRAEAAVGPDRLRDLAREAAGAVLDRGAPGWLEAVLPAVLVALGWTGPPALAAVLGLRILAGVLKRRRASRGGTPAGSKNASAPAPWNDEYAAQLAQVYELSGRSPLADATLGRQYDEELRQAEQSSDAALATWARKLRERVARRFFRIHGRSPAPAEPSETP